MGDENKQHNNAKMGEKSLFGIYRISRFGKRNGLFCLAVWFFSWCDKACFAIRLGFQCVISVAFMLVNFYFTDSICKKIVNNVTLFLSRRSNYMAIMENKGWARMSMYNMCKRCFAMCEYNKIVQVKDKSGACCFACRVLTLQS